jgi:hypothetical protein
MRTEVTEVNGIPVYTNILEEHDFATDLQKQEWTSICNSCEFKNNDRCTTCGCLLESIMNLATAKCPINKW